MHKNEAPKRRFQCKIDVDLRELAAAEVGTIREKTPRTAITTMLNAIERETPHPRDEPGVATGASQVNRRFHFCLQ